MRAVARGALAAAMLWSAGASAQATTPAPAPVPTPAPGSPAPEAPAPGSPAPGSPAPETDTGTKTDTTAAEAAAEAAVTPTPELYEKWTDELNDDLNGLETAPQSPAAFALGLGTTNVLRPGTVRDAGAALLNAFAKDGSLRTGVSVDFAPYRLLSTQYLTLEEWQKTAGFGRAMADSWTISFATAEGEADAAGVKGPVRSSLATRIGYDSADPRKNAGLFTCLKKPLGALHEAVNTDEDQPAAPGATTTVQADPKVKAEARKKAAEAIAKCYEEEGSQKGLSFVVAGGITFAGQPRDGEVDFDGIHAWLTGAYNFSDDYERRFSLFGHYVNLTDIDTHVIQVGGRFDYEINAKKTGVARTIVLNLESYVQRAQADSKDDSIAYGAAVDIELIKGASASLGVQAQTNEGRTVILVLTNLSFTVGGEKVKPLNRVTSVSP